MEHSSQPGWKRALKCGISLFVFATDETWKRLARAFGQGVKGKCVVLYYHSVPASERKLFAEQLDVVLRCTHVVRTDQNFDSKDDLNADKDYAAITFDDGFENFLTQALPELEMRKLPSTVFVIADGLSREFGSDVHAEKLLSLEQVRNLPTSLVSIGSHTLTHPLLPQVEEGKARREIQDSRTKLEGMLSRKVTEFSFPFGGFSGKLVELCRETGYDRVYTTLPAFAFERHSDFVIGRVRVDPTDWPMEFRLKLAGAYRWLPMVFDFKRRIISLASRSMGRDAVGPATPRSMVR
jgi:peptidoglycan/xylan/chitin deacetylase (PgdA/CDA1 family)